MTDPHSVAHTLAVVADRSMRLLNENRGRMDCMLPTLEVLPVPRVDLASVRSWFGDRFEFEHIELLLEVVHSGAPVAVSGEGDITAALTYGNHSSAFRYSSDILAKIVDDVLMGRAFVFPRTAAALIPSLRISPLTVAVSPTKIRICHDLSFDGNGNSVNADTDTTAVPECKIGHVLRDVIWRILYLYDTAVRDVDDPPRILLAKMDTNKAFRQVSVDINKAPVFGYVFGDVVVVDRCLQFGWTSSPSLWGVCAAAVEHSHNNTTLANAVVTAEGRDATSHVRVEQARVGERHAHLPPDCIFPQDEGGGIHDEFWVRTYVDDALFVELESVFRGHRCLRASQSFASDSFRLFGTRNDGQPPLFAREKTSSWDTRSEMLGWNIDTVGMTISVPPAKLAQLSDMLAEWPVDRRYASITDLRSLLGKLLHLCDVVRPGKFFIRRILNQLGVGSLAQMANGSEGISFRRMQNHGTVTLTREFHDDLAFWGMIVEMSHKTAATTILETPLFCYFLQPPSRTLVSDASGDSMGGYCLETGLWWRIDFPDDIRLRLRTHVCGRDDLSMNVFELLGMTITAWAFTVHANERSEYPGQSILMKGDNMSAVHWVNKCRGAKEPRGGALMRMLGCLEMRSDWRFRARHVRGVANTLADGISRWNRNEITHRLNEFRPDIRWQEQNLGQAGMNITTAILGSSLSEVQLRHRLNATTRQLSGLGPPFVG